MKKIIFMLFILFLFINVNANKIEKEVFQVIISSDSVLIIPTKMEVISDYSLNNHNKKESKEFIFFILDLKKSDNEKYIIPTGNFWQITTVEWNEFLNKNPIEG